MAMRLPLLALGVIVVVITFGPNATAQDRPASAPPPSQPGSQIKVMLTRGLTEAKEPLPPTTEFPDDAQRIYVVVTGVELRAQVRATWVAVNVEGIAPNSKLRSAGAGDWLQWPTESAPGRLALLFSAPAGGLVLYEHLKLPPGGFVPGDYRMDITVGDYHGDYYQSSVEFKIVSILPPATLVEKDAPVTSLNIALTVLGGKIEAATSGYDRLYGAPSSPASLIDGIANIFEDQDCDWCGWGVEGLPQEVVFSFSQGRQALISAVVLNTAYNPPNITESYLPKHVEVWASTTSPTEGFTKIGGARLPRRAGRFRITFPPAQAKYVKLRFVSTYGYNTVYLSEVEIYEAPDGAPSILADRPKNLAHVALGGAIVRYTSLEGHYWAGELVDTARPTSYGWRSADSHLPQEIVFAFRRDRVALIDRLVLTPRSEENPSSWPQTVTVSVSTENPFDGFEEVGQFTLTQEARAQAFPLNRRARFVKLRVLQNYGGDRTSLGEVQVIEGSAPGYRSVLLDTPEATTDMRGATSPAGDETGIALETESNNLPAEANLLEFGRRTKGTIDPLGENDHFKFSLPGEKPSAVTLELLGKPNIRTSLTLLDTNGNALKQFDPGRTPGQRAEFSWALTPGDHVVRVTESQISIVLIWDTSGSMDQHSVENLQRAVEAYIDQVRPSEQLNLIRFSSMKTEETPAVEVLLPEFTSDRELLKAATQAKFFAKGNTPLYDAIAKGIELLDSVQGNRAIVVMTDGIDTASKLDHPDFWRLLEEKRVRLYTIGLGEELLWHVWPIGSNGERVLGHAALATNGRYFFARTSDELKGLYQQIADELRAPSTYYLRPTLSRGPGRLGVMATGERMTAVAAPPQIELILDASGSMKQKVEGRPKMDLAKEAMTQIIESLPDDLRVALRIYGHRIREKQPGDCQDSELVFPFAKIDKPRLLERVRAIKALGTTPIAYSLQQVAADFGSTPGEKMVILVTDGKEECKGNPSAAVSELLAKNLQVRLNIVGFALADEATKQELERVAALTGGRFFDASDAKGLRKSIEQALAVPYEVRDAAGAKVGSGMTGQKAPEVPEGIYTVVVGAAGAPITIPDVRVVHNEFTKIELKKEGQEIGKRVVRAASLEEVVTAEEPAPPSPVKTSGPATSGVAVVKVEPAPPAAKPAKVEKPAPVQEQVKKSVPAAREEKVPLGWYRVIVATPLRSEPRTNAEILAQLQRQTRVRVVGVAGDYLEVRSMKEGRPPGYVLRKDVIFASGE